MAIGIGVWKGAVNTMFYKGEFTFTVRHENGAYSFTIDASQPLPDYKINSVEEEGNSLVATVSTSLLPGREIPVSVTFEGDTMFAEAKIPFIDRKSVV